MDLDNDRLLAVLSDFGIARIITDKTLLVRAFHVANIEAASYQFAAPEILLGHRETDCTDAELLKASDVYSYGMVMINMMTRRLPWQNCRTPEEIIKKLEQKMRPIVPPEIVRYAANNAAMQQMLHLTFACWDEDPRARPSMDQVMKTLNAKLNAENITISLLKRKARKRHMAKNTKESG